MTEEKKEPEDPSSWTSFYTATKAKIDAVREARRTDAIRKTLASQEKINALVSALERGRESKKLVESEFWKNEVEPFLRSEAVLKPWISKDGEPAPSERAFNEYLVGSGQVRVLTRLLSRLEQWQVEGVEADKILNADMERRKALT